MTRSRLLAAAAAGLLLTISPASAQNWLADPQMNLRQAAPAGGFDMAKARDALRRGADINHRYREFGGDTVLITAVRFGAGPEAVRFLLENGADPTIADNNGRSAAFYASGRSIDPQVAALIAARSSTRAGAGGAAQGVAATAPARPQPARDLWGAQLSYTTADKLLRDAMAAYTINEAQARQALAAGADVNHRDAKNNNQTLLIDKVRGGADVSVIRWLLQNGADPRLTDSRGRTAADYASPLSSPDVAALLGVRRRATPVSVAEPQTASAAENAAPIRPGVYECYGQNNMVGPMAFSVLDGSTYMDSFGKTGRYSYDRGSGVLSLGSGGAAARFRRTSATSFRAMNPDGSLAGFTCPLNTAKNPRRPNSW